MSTYAELVAKDQAIRDVLTDGAEARLRAFPGVLHVSVGLKVAGGRVTDRHSVRVYVQEKRPAGLVPPAERIPAEIGGALVDVNVVGRLDFTNDYTRYRPLVGGIQISNRIIDVNDAGTKTGIPAGTMGCIATLTADRSPVVLTNWHIMMGNGASIGDRVYQPPPSTLPPAELSELPIFPTDTTDAIGRIAKFAITGKVDAAVARIDVSSCCHCCGIDFRNEINGLSVDGHPPTNAVVGQRAAVSGMKVYKVGMQTLRTVGNVVDTDYPPFDITRNGETHTFTGQIEVACDDPTTRFTRSGDSGAVLVDDEGFVVGLHFASSSDDPPDHRSFANHIADVCSALGITINTTPPANTAGARIAVPAAETYRAVSARLRAAPGGARLLELAERHRPEIVALVNHERHVTVAWHRVHGPALLAAVANTLRAGGDELPTTPPDRSLDTALERMGAVLAEHGSAALRAALDADGPALLAAVRGSGTLTEVLAKLETAPAGEPR